MSRSREPTNLRVPKSMDPDHVVWAFRHGVAWARYSVLGDASALRRHGLAYTNHYRNVHALAGRVRVAAERRLRDRVAHRSTVPEHVASETKPDQAGTTGTENHNEQEQR